MSELRTLIVDDEAPAREILREYLSEHPEVEEIAVFGVPDEKYGEEVGAWIRLRENGGTPNGDAPATIETLQEWARSRIAHFKVPRLIWFVDSFPMTVTGKVQKFVMREQMKEELAVDGGD